MTTVYLDWNVFNKLEKLDLLNESEIPVYSKILELIENGTITIPYSNAHLNDLIRGYLKNPVYTEGHLDSICRITKNLCIAQYWGKDHATIHTRDVKTFFNEACGEINSMPTTYSGLMESIIIGLQEEIEEMESELTSAEKKLMEEPIKLIQQQLTQLKSAPLPLEFQKLFEADPIFERIYPKSQEQMNYLALLDDIMELNRKIISDYSIYKGLKKYINSGRKYFEDNIDLLKQIGDKGPKHLTFDEAIKTDLADKRRSKNELLDQITNKFYEQDIKGHHSDEKFVNMIDDGLHTFYAAHFDFFVTIDSKCLYKAAEVYKQLGIDTQVLNPLQFLETFSPKS